MDDISAYKKYPHHHKWFNKLWLSEKLGLSFIGVKSPGSYPFDKNILTIEDFFELEKYL